MRFRRSITALAGAAALTAGALVTVPPAHAASQTVAVNCAVGVDIDLSFTVSPGDEIVFTLNSDCQTLMLAGMALYNLTFQQIVDRMAILTGTNGTAMANQVAWTVTYTAGPNFGTDTLDVSAGGMAPRSLLPRTVTSSFYSMTNPNLALVSWLQAYARAASDTCDTGWSPSWAEWPNGGAGGFVCVRSMVYNYSTGKFDARRLLKQQHVIESLR